MAKGANLASAADCSVAFLKKKKKNLFVRFLLHLDCSVGLLKNMHPVQSHCWSQIGKVSITLTLLIA